MSVEVSEEVEQVPSIRVRGEPLLLLPNDLYIPPDAMEVFLDLFQGPLDLLLYLIKKQNLDILNIPILDITNQYMQYVELMKEVKLELAADYLVMAAVLAEIKSRTLLPRPQLEGEAVEEDPRAELIRRLQEYERFKKAADALDEHPRIGRDTWPAFAIMPDKPAAPRPVVEMSELMKALAAVIQRADLLTAHAIEREPLSVRERMSQILERLQQHAMLTFDQVFDAEEGRSGIVITFIAMLELLKESLIDITQSEAFGPIYLKAVQDDGCEAAEASEYH